MASYYTLQSGTGVLVLEDASGNLLLQSDAGGAGVTIPLIVHHQSQQGSESMLYLRQSTASQEIPLGRFLDSTDGNTEETALTINNTDIKIWKTGATTLASKNSGGATHIANGVYYCVLDATDTDTIGPLMVTVHVAGALSNTVYCNVLDELVYDVLFGTVALASTTNITAGTITTATNVTTVNGLAASVITAASIATDAIGAAEIAADAVTEIRSLVSGTSDSGTTTTMVDAARTEGDTDYWKGQYIVFTSGTISGQARLITGFNAATDTITFTPATTQTVGTQTYEIWPGGGVDLLTILGTAVSTPATAGILDVNVKNIDNDAASASGTVTFPNATLASTTNITAGTITTATNVTTVNGLAANVITAAATAADFGTEIATAIWTDTTAGDFTVAASVGKSVMNGVALGTGLTVAAVSGAVGSVTGAVGSVTGAVGSVTGNVGGNVTGSIGSLAAQAKTDVTAAANTVAMTESYAALAAAPTPAQIWFEIRALLAEKAVSGTTLTAKKLDGATTAATFTLDDAVTPSAITRAS